MSQGWLTGKVALVTGGSSGIGAGIVERFVVEGAMVCVLDKRADERRVSETILNVRGNVISAQDNRRAVAAAVAEFGRLDVFIGNAGIFDGDLTLTEMSDEQIDGAVTEILSVNVKGYLLGVRAALDELTRVRGCVVLTLSSAAFHPGGGGPIYTASKQAGVGIVRQLAHELAPHVRVNGVAPGGTVTDLRGPIALGQGDRSYFADDSGWPSRIRQGRPLQMELSPADHAGAYVYLASAQNSSAVTGEIIRTDGGLAAQ